MQTETHENYDQQVARLSALKRLNGLKEEQSFRSQGIKTSRYWQHVPYEKQRIFLALDYVPEVFYGGAASGGKSDALLMGALQYVDVPGYAAIIFRRTYTDLSLPGALLNRAKEWLIGLPGVKWVPSSKTFEFKTRAGARPATVTFAYLATNKDRMRYKSAEFQYIAFDELTQFEEGQYTYLFSRLRRTHDIPVPLRMRSGSNPGDIGHDWVQERFVDKPDDNPDRRRFVPARFVDNPFVDQEEYARSLGELTIVERMQLEDGDWNVKPQGSLFRNAKWLYCEADEVPEDLPTVRYWDQAATEPAEPGQEGNKNPDYTAGCLMAFDDGPAAIEKFGKAVVYIIDMVHGRWGPAGVEKQFKDTGEEDGKTIPVQLEEEGGASGKLNTFNYQRLLPTHVVTGRRVSRAKHIRWRTFIAWSEHGRVILVRGPWNRPFLNETRVVTEDGKYHDDQIDGCEGAHSFLVLGEPELIYR